MSKFNRPDVGATRSGVGPITSASTRPNARTALGAAGYTRDARSELFLLATSNFVGEETFHEGAEARDERFVKLVREVAPSDPAWFLEFVRWLRVEAHMRSAPLVAAAEGVTARLAAGAPSVPAYELPGFTTDRGIERVLIDVALQRADEPGELLGYWAKTRGYESASVDGPMTRVLTRLRALPKPIKRGLADAATRLYSERSLLKWDTASHAFRFGDVIELTHPRPRGAWQDALFRYALDRRHGRENLNQIGASLPMIYANAMLRARVERGDLRRLLDSEELRAAGMTWEDALSLGGKSLDKRALWESVIPSMGYMALVRNLRNFDQHGISDELAERVVAKLVDPAEVAASRQLPFRFLAAHRNVPSLRWGHALETALNHSLANVPALDGRTLILVDRSPSMFPGYHFSTPNKSDISLADQAAVFGAALALRAANPTLVEFGGESRVIRVPRGGSVLRLVGEFTRSDGTDIPSAVRAHFARHDRVIVVTDEQTRPGYLPSNMRPYGGMPETPIDDLVPRDVPLYMWNMAGYRVGATPAGSSNRHTLGGLTDSAFRLIPLLEAGLNGRWPWELAAVRRADAVG